MFAKLAVVVLTIGVCACTLLSLRQARLQAAHELTRAQLRVRECDDRLWAMRAEIARRVMPDQVHQMADALGSFRPMLPLPTDFERRSAYASLELAPSPLKVESKARSMPGSGAEIRTVSHPTRTPERKELVEKPAPSSTKKLVKPEVKTVAASKPVSSSKTSTKAAAKPEAKVEAKPDVKAEAKRNKPAGDRKQAIADRPERRP